MKIIFHGMPESGANIFETKRHDSICKCTPRGHESCFIMTLGAYSNCIVFGESIYKEEDFLDGTWINDLIDEWSRLVVFGIWLTQILEVRAYTDRTLFFGDRDRVGKPTCVFNRKDELSLALIINFNFNGQGFGRVHQALLLVYGRSIKPCVNVMLNDNRV